MSDKRDAERIDVELPVVLGPVSTNGKGGDGTHFFANRGAAHGPYRPYGQALQRWVAKKWARPFGLCPERPHAALHVAHLA
ncbi:MAG: hypothetical protein HZA24_11685 [Nitrospirae bacterium]|nr:hypothetical protein [Nitrospirota bacterium]